MLNGPPAMAWISVSSATSDVPTSWPISRSLPTSSRMPRHSTLAEQRRPAAAPCRGRAPRTRRRRSAAPAGRRAPATAAASAPRRGPTSSTEMSEPGRAEAPVPIQLPRAAGGDDPLGGGDDVEIVVRARGVEQVGRQHRVRGHARERQPALPEQHLQRLDVVHVLGDRGRRQHGGELGEGRLGEADRRAEVAVVERQVGAPAAGEREREPDQIAAHGRHAVVERRDPDRPCRFDLPRELGERRAVEDRVDGDRRLGNRRRRDRRRRGARTCGGGLGGVLLVERHQLLGQPRELQLAEEPAQALLIGIDPVQLRQRLRQRRRRRAAGPARARGGSTRAPRRWRRRAFP